MKSNVFWGFGFLIRAFWNLKLKVLKYPRNCRLHATLIPNLVKPLNIYIYGRVATPTRFSIFYFDDMKSLWFKGWLWYLQTYRSSISFQKTAEKWSFQLQRLVILQPVKISWPKLNHKLFMWLVYQLYVKLGKRRVTSFIFNVCSSFQSNLYTATVHILY